MRDPIVVECDVECETRRIPESESHGARAGCREGLLRSDGRGTLIASIDVVMGSPTLDIAKRLAEDARDAQSAGDHRRAARLYMHAVLALTGVLPLAEARSNTAKTAAAARDARTADDVA